MKLEILARSALVAVIAAVCSGVPAVLLFTVGMDDFAITTVGGGVMGLALLGCFLIGLPLALLLFHFVQRQEHLSPLKLIIWANLAATGLVAAIMATAGILGVLIFGIAIFIAANVFAIAGWFLVIKPSRAQK